jgi:hypothetical protein
MDAVRNCERPGHESAGIEIRVVEVSEAFFLEIRNENLSVVAGKEDGR